MSSAVAFPGLNSFLKAENRTRLLHYSCVKDRLAEAERLLRTRLGLEVDFHKLLQMETSVLYSHQNVSLTTVAIIAIQVGVWEELRKTNFRPDWVIGCSLGDLTKAIVTGVCSFEAAVNIPMLTLSKDIEINQLGEICAVTTSRRSIFTEDDLQWFETQNLDVSRMSNRMMTVSGRFSDLKSLSDMAARKKWRIKTLVDFPIHSRFLNHYDEVVRTMASKVDFKQPTSEFRAYSSMDRKPIDKSSDFQKELIQLMTSPLHWRDSVIDLIQNYGVKQLINIGPCDALGSLSKDMDLPLEVFEADDLISAQKTWSYSSGATDSPMVFFS